MRGLYAESISFETSPENIWSKSRNYDILECFVTINTNCRNTLGKFGNNSQTIRDAKLFTREAIGCLELPTQK